MKPNKVLNSNGLDSHDSIESQLNDLLKPLGCQVIPFEQVAKQPVSKYTIVDPDGITLDAVYFSLNAVEHALLDCDDVLQVCRKVIHENKEGPLSAESEEEWMLDIAVSEAKELGYKIEGVKS